MVRNSRSSAPLPPPQADRTRRDAKKIIKETLFTLPSPRSHQYIHLILMIREFQFSIKQNLSSFLLKQHVGRKQQIRRSSPDGCLTGVGKRSPSALLQGQARRGSPVSPNFSIPFDRGSTRIPRGPFPFPGRILFGRMNLPGFLNPGGDPDSRIVAGRIVGQTAAVQLIGRVLLVHGFTSESQPLRPFPFSNKTQEK